MTWHWDVIPRNFKYFMMGRLSIGALAWWGLVALSFVIFCLISYKIYRYQSLGNRLRRNLYFLALIGEIAALYLARDSIGKGIEFLNLGGFLLTVIVAIVVIIATFFIGIVAGLMRTSRNVFIRIPAILYIEIIRGGPVLMGIFWFYFMLPEIFTGLKGIPQAEMMFATTALIAIYGAYMAEVIRAGILSIPQGQMEAAHASGLSTAQAFTYIILPQGMKNMIPAIVGTFITVIKDTSLIYIIGVAEFTRTVFQVNNRVMNAPMELFIFAAVVYFIPCWLLSKFSFSLEKKLTISHQKI